MASFTYTYNVGGQLTRRVENFGGAGLTETFAYDAGGCLTSSNLPASIIQGGYTRTYTYDTENQRDYSVLTKSNTTLPFAASKRYYFGDFERNINTENGVVTDSDYIFADGRLVALVKTTGGTKTAYGVLTDRQGSLRALYNGSGLVQSFSYDAWGNRRNPSTGNALTTSELVTANSITSRGYTCHEHMDEFGLINMNARIYDPALGMFISVDPLAQDYYDTYPYAYCGGDPVNAVDPTGESTWVVPNGDGTYRVVGGDIYDGDLTIYSLSFQLGAFAFDPLGASLTITSFYDSDANNGEGAWAYGSIIDPPADEEVNGKNTLFAWLEQSKIDF